MDAHAAVMLLAEGALLEEWSDGMKETGEPPARIENFIEEVVPRYDDRQFREHFRMDRFCIEVGMILRCNVCCYLFTFS